MRWLVTVALLVVAAPRAYAQPNVEHPSETPITEPSDPLFRDGGDAQCAPRRGVPLDPGYFAALGSFGRDLEGELSLAGGSETFGGTLFAGGTARIDEHYFALARLRAAISHLLTEDTSVGSLPAIEVGIGARSDCDRWNVTATAGWAPPSTGTGAPEEWEVAIPSALALGPMDAYLYLPRGTTGAWSLAFDARVRTDGSDWFGAFWLAMRFGTAEVLSRYGQLRGFVGSIALEGAVGLRTPWGVTLNLEIGARFEVDLSSFWPSNAVGPFALTFPVRWAPESFITLEAWVGFTDFLVAERTNLPPGGPAGGLRVQLFADL